MPFPITRILVTLSTFQKELTRNKVIKKIIILEKKCQDLDHDVKVVKASRQNTLDELIESMRDYKIHKPEVNNKLHHAESFIDKLETKIELAVQNIHSYVCKITEDFLTDYKDLKQENTGLSREFKRSLQEYRGFITEMTQSQDRQAWSTEKNTKRNLVPLKEELIKDQRSSNQLFKNLNISVSTITRKRKTKQRYFYF